MMKRLIQFLAGLLFFVLIMPVSAMAADTLCAQVKIQVNQDLTLERQAFEAHMRINNGLTGIAIEDVAVQVNFSDEAGNPVSATSDPDNTEALFYIRLDSMSGIDDVDGNGLVSPSSSANITWLIIPAPDSSNGVTEGTLYYVGATLSYTMAGQEQTIDVMPDYIYVKPMPELTLDYFLPKYVYGDDPLTSEIEPEVPFPFGLRIANNGEGTARSLSIVSAQPKITENKLGLLISFNIIGAELNGEEGDDDLRVDFGDLESGTAQTVKWIMVCSLYGEFKDFSADFTHSDELGGELTSVMESVNPHELIKDVRVDLPGSDEIDDFLARDGTVVRVFESENQDTVVTDYDDAQASIQSADADAYSITFPATPGFAYTRLPDPENGQKIIAEVVRSDGKIIKSENCWLSKSKDQDNNWEYFIHIFDADTSGAYTVSFDFPLPEHAPVMQFIPDRAGAVGRYVGFLIQASDPDGTVPSLSVAPLPAGAALTDNGDGSALFEWTPGQGQAGVYTLTFTATDGENTASRTATLTIVDDVDSDNDGMADAWELLYFGNLDRDGTGDYDGDGISDLDEFLNGSNPVEDYRIFGDFDVDDDVDGWDLVQMMGAMDSRLGDGNYLPGADSNRDDLIDHMDLATFSRNYGALFQGQNYPPLRPFDPDPADGAVNVSVDQLLSWTGGDPDAGDFPMYDVLFGLEADNLARVLTTDEKEYYPGLLDYDTTYFWQIISKDRSLARTNGPVWQFSTFAADGDADGDGLLNHEEIEGETVTDPFNWDTDGDGYSDGDEVDGGTSPVNADSRPPL